MLYHTTNFQWMIGWILTISKSILTFQLGFDKVNKAGLRKTVHGWQDFFEDHPL